MKFESCAECGGRCCTGLSIPKKYAARVYTTGVPISLYESALDRDPRRYFELHDGVTISKDGKNFIVAPRIPIYPKDGSIFVDSRCLMLNSRGRCIIYLTRPDMCRNFTKETAQHYTVPEGCKYA